MELSSPTAADTSSAPSRRKSGRVTKAPEILGATKRKRNADNGDAEDASDADSSDENDDDDEPDEEEMKEQRKRARKSNAAKPKAPAKKKAKAVNGEPMSLAIRPAKNATKAKAAPKRRKPQPANAADAESVGGLYGRSHPTAIVNGSLQSKLIIS